MGLINSNNINNIVSNNDNIRRYLHKKLSEIASGEGGEFATNEEIDALFGEGGGGSSSSESGSSESRAFIEVDDLGLDSGTILGFGVDNTATSTWYDFVEYLMYHSSTTLLYVIDNTAVKEYRADIMYIDLPFESAEINLDYGYAFVGIIVQSGTWRKI